MAVSSIFVFLLSISLVSAVWWNPFTWFDNNQPLEIVEKNYKVVVQDDFSMRTEWTSNRNIIYPDGTMLSCPIMEITKGNKDFAIQTCFTTDWKNGQGFEVGIGTSGQVEVTYFKGDGTKVKKIPPGQLKLYYSENQIEVNETTYLCDDSFSAEYGEMNLDEETWMKLQEEECDKQITVWYEWEDWEEINNLKNKLVDFELNKEMKI